MDLSRRNFITSVSMLAAGSALTSPLTALARNGKKLRVVLVGTGVRGAKFWGARLVEEYSDVLEFVGLSDINPGRLAYAKKFMGVDCPTFVDFDEMLETTKPDLVIVTTVDSTHHEFIIKGLQADCDVITEKPMTTDEDKCQAILDAERKSKKNVIVGFNYRWSPYMTHIKKLLSGGTIGDVVSVDFNWMLNTSHGASYFRRWHGLRQCGGTLWVHKATHHFDLLNWWLDSDPQEVFAYGDLEYYGSNGKIRGKNCRSCEHKKECKFYWDITKKSRDMAFYCDNEKYDGYIKDNCLFRNEINIYDKMSAQIKYANNAVASYSLTTYSPYEGWKIAFNGTGGRIEAWHRIPFMTEKMIDQDALHEAEMRQDDKNSTIEPMVVHQLWNKHRMDYVTVESGGHWGGDARLQNKTFLNPEAPDPYKHSAGTRDGAMSILVGIAARKSIEAGKPIRIAELTDLEPRAKRI